MYRLLIVEDEEFLRKSLCVMIDWQGLGIQVAGAVENGGEALRFLQEQGMERPVDIVLTDIRMPVMDGLELAGELQSRYPGIKTVLYSAYSEFSFAQKGIEYGVSGYLLKSQDEEEIENYFREMCHRMQKEAAQPNAASSGDGFWKKRESLSDRLLAGVSTEKAEAAIREGALCKLDLSRSPAAVALFELDESAMLREELGGLGMRQLHKFLAEQVLARLEWQGLGQLLQFGEPVIALWTDFSAGWPSRLRRLHQELSEELKSFETGAPVTLTVAVGTPSPSLSGLPESWEKARERLSKRFFLGAGLVLDSSCSLSVDGPPELSPAEIRTALQEAETLCRCRDLPGLLAFLESLKQSWKARAVTDRSAANWFGVKLLSAAASSDVPEEAATSLVSRSGELVRLISRSDTLDSLFEQLNLACGELLEGAPAAFRQQKKLVEKAIRFLQENYTSDISLERTAAYVCVHPVHLSRLFRQETGQTFKNMLTQLRMEKAKELLRNLDLRVYEISESVGYKKPRYFSELFKEVTGMTPLEYREKC